MSTRCVIIPSLLWLAACGLGCATPRSSSSQPASISHRNPKASIEANLSGLELVEQDKFDDAETAFREAVRLDLRNAAAHNNLGLVLLSKGDLYQAAVEFRMASKLNPQAKEPVANLAQLYEQVGWEKEAKGSTERNSNPVSSDCTDSN